MMIFPAFAKDKEGMSQKILKPPKIKIRVRNIREQVSLEYDLADKEDAVQHQQVEQDQCYLGISQICRFANVVSTFGS